MKYIDIHCHLDFPDYENDFQNVLNRMKEQEVGAITIGTDLESSKKAVEIAEANNNVWACIGVHPEDGEDEIRGDFDESFFDSLCESRKVVAVGECGLDWFRIARDVETEKKRQKILFEKQIQFAIKHDLSLMLHIRTSGRSSMDAYEEGISILADYKKDAGEKLRGDVHFFAGDQAVAKKFLDLGFTMSFTGVITFTSDYNEVIKYIPANSIMSETDAPFVAPTPYRGKRNEPLYVIEVVKKMAEIRGVDANILNKSILENFKRVFKIE